MEETALRQAREEFMRQHASQTEVCAWIWDIRAQRLKYVSASVHGLLGYGVEEAMETPPTAWMLPASLERLQARNFARLLQFFVAAQREEDGVHTADYDYRCKDGTIKRLCSESRFYWDDVAQNLEVFVRLWEQPAPPQTGTAVQAVRLCCFGKFRLYAPHGRQPLRWRTKKAEELAAFLFSSGKREIGKWEICDALWQDCDPEKTGNHLHTTIYSLKRTLDGARVPFSIKYQNGYYHVTLPEIRSDAAQVEELETSGMLTRGQLTDEQLRRIKKALARYENDYLEENGYAWAMAQKAHYRALFKALTLKAAAQSLEKGDCVAAQDLLQRLLRIDNLCEDAHELLLRTLLAMHDRSAFRSHYAQMEELFRTELGLPPTLDMQALLEQA